MFHGLLELSPFVQRYEIKRNSWSFLESAKHKKYFATISCIGGYDEAMATLNDNCLNIFPVISSELCLL